MSENNQKLSKKENIIQAIKFALFSASAGIIQFGSFTLFQFISKQISPDTEPVYIYCYLPSLILSVLWNFTFNRRFTFKSANNIPIAMLKVALFYCVFAPLSAWCGHELEALGVNDFIIEIGTMAVNLVTEYLFCRFVVYRNSMNTRK